MAAGRKRKAGLREPSGKLSRSSKPQIDSISGVVWQRMLRRRGDVKNDPRDTSQIAWLHAQGQLNSQHVVVAFKIGETYGRFERLIGRSRSVKGFSYEIGFSGFDLPTEEQEAARDERERKARTAFDELDAELKVLPRTMRSAIETLCVEDRHILPVFQDDLRRFFGRLALKWGIGSARKQGGARPNSGPAPRAIDARTHIVATEPARPKANVERVAWFRAIRILCPHLEGDALQESYELYRALKDATALRLQVERKRARTPTPHRPELMLSEQQEQAA